MVNFWDKHGLLFLIFITLFPRLTLIFSSVATGGVFWWLGFIFVPRILVAVLATLSYADTNPILVILSWFIAFSGESTEKYTLRRNVPANRYSARPRASQENNAEVIDAEYKKL